MKKMSLSIVFRIACGWLLVTRLAAADSPRERLSLAANWKFHLGDDWPKALRLDTVGANARLASEKLGDIS
jgi:beta-galactosidase